MIRITLLYKIIVIYGGQIMKKRNLSLDMLRTISMLMIVLSHVIGHGKVIDSLEWGNINFILIKAISALLIVKVDCFVLISGYFLCESNFKLKKAISLWFAALFWSLGLYLLLVVCNAEVFSIKNVIQSSLILTQNRYWFLTTYLLMFFMIPILNAAIKNMNQRQHMGSIGIFFLIYICLQNLFYWTDFAHSSADNPMFFMFLYTIAAYFRRYPIKNKYHWFIGYGLCCLWVFAWEIFVEYFSVKFLGYKLGIHMFSANSSVCVVLASVFLFLGFMQIDIKNIVISKLISVISPLTFGVYLIHDQPAIRNIIWEQIFKPYQYVDKPYLVAAVLLIAIIVFVICCCAEFIRLKLWKAIRVDTIIEIISNKIESICAFLLSKIINIK